MSRGAWIAAVLDALFVGFCLTMIASRRARYAFAEWMSRNSGPEVGE